MIICVGVLVGLLGKLWFRLFLLSGDMCRFVFVVGKFVIGSRINCLWIMLGLILCISCDMMIWFLYLLLWLLVIMSVIGLLLLWIDVIGIGS